MLLPGRLASSLSAFQEDQDTVIALWSSDPIGRCRLAQVPPDFVEPPHFPAIQPSDHPILISFVSRSCPDPIRLLSPAIQLPRQAGTFGFFTRSPAGSGDPSSDRPPAVSNAHSRLAIAATHAIEVEEAHKRALGRYTVRFYPGKITLMRTANVRDCWRSQESDSGLGDVGRRRAGHS